MIKRAMILAAGEGRRMRPLTLHTPKPLLRVGERSLIEWQLQKLAAAGIEEVVINVAYLAQQVIAHLGDEAYGLRLRYSREPEPLETGGALNRALPFLAGSPFLLINGDIWTDFPIQSLLQASYAELGAHLVMIPNPAHHPRGDFLLNEQTIEHICSAPPAAKAEQGIVCTFSGISVFKPETVENYPRRREKFALREVLDWLIDRRALSGELYSGEWMDIGTPERLQCLTQKLV